MSLIQKALEKSAAASQQEISLDTFLKKPTHKLPPQTAETRKLKSETSYRTKTWKFLLLCFFMIAQAAVVYYLLLQQPQPAIKSVSPSIKAVVKPPEVNLVSTTLLLPALSKLNPVPTLALSGITVKGDDKFAIINNRVISLGAEVSPGIVVRDILVQEKTVVVEVEGQSLTLKL